MDDARTLLPSTQVTKSSRVRVTRKAGSVTISGPTRTWPCSRQQRNNSKADENINKLMEGFHKTTKCIVLQWACSCAGAVKNEGSRGALMD